MKRIVRLTENDLIKLVKKVIKESENDRYATNPFTGEKIHNISDMVDQIVELPEKNYSRNALDLMLKVLPELKKFTPLTVKEFVENILVHAPTGKHSMDNMHIFIPVKGNKNYTVPIDSQMARELRDLLDITYRK